MTYEQLPAFMKDELLAAYESGEMASFIHGERWQRILKQVASTISCMEQGSKAELARLKDYLGGSLPVDWERIRFERYKIILYEET